MGGHGISMNPKKEKRKKKKKKGGIGRKVQKYITRDGLNGNSLMGKSQLTGLAS